MVTMTMRDSSTDYETGWLYDGYYDRHAPLAASGFSGLDGRGGRGQADVVARNMRMIPPSGRRYINEAMRDPQARPIVIKLMSSANPSAALARQAEQDLAESVKSTGKVIVFKTLVRKLSGRLKAVEDAMVNAQNPNSTIGRTAVGIALTSKNPHAAVQEFITNVALAAIAPEATYMEDMPDDLSGLGKSWKKKLKSIGQKVQEKAKEIARNPTVRKVAVAAAVVAAVAITGGAIIPALASAAPLVAGAAGGAFKKTPEQIAAEGEAGTVGPVWDPVRAEWVQPTTATTAAAAAGGGGINLASVAGAAIEIYKLKMTGDVAKAGILHQQAMAQLQAQGMSEAQAQALLSQGMQQAAETYGPGQAAPATSQQFYLPGGGGAQAPMEASMFSPDTIKYGLIAVVSLGTLYGITQAIRAGGGSRRGSRRR